MSMRLEEFMKQDKILEILAMHEEARSIVQQIENAILGHKIHSIDVSYQAGAMVTCFVFRFEENDAYSWSIRVKDHVLRAINPNFWLGIIARMHQDQVDIWLENEG